MEAKKIDQPTDPALANEQAQAAAANITNLQTQAQNDTASLMARYGTRLALSGMNTPTNNVTSATVGKT